MRTKALTGKVYPMVHDVARAKQVMGICNVDHETALFALAVNNEDQSAAIEYLIGDGNIIGRHPFVGVYAGPTDVPGELDAELGNVGRKICYLCRREEVGHFETTEQFLKRQSDNIQVNDQAKLMELQQNLFKKINSEIQEQGEEVCPVCYEVPIKKGQKDTMVFDCGHFFCTYCA